MSDPWKNAEVRTVGVVHRGALGVETRGGRAALVRDVAAEDAAAKAVEKAVAKAVDHRQRARERAARSRAARANDPGYRERERLRVAAHRRRTAAEAVETPEQRVRRLHREAYERARGAVS